MVKNLAELGKTILLTTHYLDEAQQLADRVAVIRAGEIVSVGTPAQLIAGVPLTQIRYRNNGETVVIDTETPTAVLAELTTGAVSAGVELEGLEVRRPTLEDVYLDLVGGARDTELEA